MRITKLRERGNNMAPKYIEVVIKMDGVQYTEKEAQALVASLAERSDLNHHGIEVTGSKKLASPPSEPNLLATTQNPNYDPATGQIIGPGDARFQWYDQSGQLHVGAPNLISPYGGMNYGQQYAPSVSDSEDEEPKPVVRKKKKTTRKKKSAAKKTSARRRQK